jgi:serine/threonine protein kinase
MASRPPTTATLPKITVGTRLTDFTTLDLTVEGMASGGMGLVAWGPNAARGGEMMAVKLIRPDLLAGRTEAERARLRADFEREALIWCHVWPHAAIIAADALTRLPGWDDLPVLQLEYAPGGNLRAAITRGHQPGSHIPLDVAFAWGQQIAAALAAIHIPDPDHERPQPLVHCDLKPENVLLDADGGGKLTDLGLTRAYADAPLSTTPIATSATATDKRQAGIQTGLHPPNAPALPAPSLTLAAAALATRSVRVPRLPTAHAVGSRGPVAGTPAYMAPEQWLGLDAVGPATDVYALGVLLFELFAGVDTLPIIPDLSTVRTHEEMFVAWYEAHRQGPSLRLSDPQVAALDIGPLSALLVGAAGTDGAERAREVLEGLERLVAACLAERMERRPTAEQVRARLVALAQRAGLAPTPIPEGTPHTPESEAIFWSNLGVTAGHLGQMEERLRLCRRAAEVDPEDPVNWSNLGVARGELGQAEVALAAYQQAEQRLTYAWVARYPALRTMVPNNLGNVLRDLRRYAEGVAAYQRALALTPDMANTRFNLALTYRDWAMTEANGAQREERLRRAQGELRHAIAIQPGYVQARQVLAEVEELLRRDG